MEDLITKYNTPGPRYTSYPTVPHWNNDLTKKEWTAKVSEQFWRSRKAISIYIHLPFCESLCTYCGCTTRITKNHSVEEDYITYLLKEWHLYLAKLGARPILKELHLGGGTPTFFSPQNLERLIQSILKTVDLPEDYEFGFEGHPANTKKEHLQVLSQLGFRRVSLGVQDFDPAVQSIINRKQTYGQILEVMENAKAFGFTGINFDLVYGLPLQTLTSVIQTIERTIELKPSRIAYYGYAHIPWIKAAQKSFEAYLPDVQARQSFYRIGKELFADAGYKDIGMDHFALESDKLYQAYANGTLHRNFMGYTTQETYLLIGLGMSAISDSWMAFGQNEKLLASYYASLDQGQLPLMKGHRLTDEDMTIRQHILDLMCTFRTNWSEEELLRCGMHYNTDLLSTLAEDGLIEWGDDGIHVTPNGRPFVRNICMALDAHLWSGKAAEARFSKTV